jgi:predicted HicB family RNase H-like nuclease
VKKDLKYYLSLRYPITITPIAEDRGGGYEASILQLGRYTFVGDGDTIENAIKNLNKLKKEYFKNFLKERITIPEPERGDEEHSGRILLRLPKYIHKALLEQARNAGVSLNQHVSNLLAFGIPIHELKKTIKEMCDLWNAAVYTYEFSVPQKQERPVSPLERPAELRVA